MKGHNFYEPQVGDSEPMQIRGFPVTIGGTYVLVDDVVTALRAYAQSLSDPEHGAVIHELAGWLQTGEMPTFETPQETVEPVFAHGSESDDVTPDVDRIEVYPDPPDDPRPKWYARSVDTGGYILKITNGSYDFEWVVKNAQERWPGVPVHRLKSAGEDSKWMEDAERGAFPSIGPPIRRLWAGVGR